MLLSGLALVGSTGFVASPLLAARPSVVAEARNVATEFFRSINARDYERTCSLLSAGYYERHKLQSKRDCALGLRVGFTWAQEIRFRLTGVRRTGDRLVVEAIADGASGSLVLVPEHGRLRILSVNG